ncbi:hypothetical protein [uncultured Campylobacter sp.]|uniref:hypothetical protein n=1 Tax=uncultured Campylobacter sp. TaxID=218934 RepID=UPI002613C8AB|nr:hypothetical protein [uncultured Campylobacter sp.]
MEILEQNKDYSKLKIFDEIRQKHGIIVAASGQTVYYADKKGIKRIAYALKCKIHHKG